MDSSESNNETRCGVVLYKKILKKCLPKEVTIFPAKICAINLALKLVSTSNKEKFIIHSDSISILLSLKNTKFDNPFFVKLLNKLNPWTIAKRGYSAESQAQGNNKVDSLAKAALNMVPDKKSRIPYTDLKLKIRQKITKKWQQLWEKNPQQPLPSTAHLKRKEAGS